MTSNPKKLWKKFHWLVPSNADVRAASRDSISLNLIGTTLDKLIWYRSGKSEIYKNVPSELDATWAINWLISSRQDYASGLSEGHINCDLSIALMLRCCVLKLIYIQGSREDSQVGCLRPRHRSLSGAEETWSLPEQLKIIELEIEAICRK